MDGRTRFAIILDTNKKFRLSLPLPALPRRPATLPRSTSLCKHQLKLTTGLVDVDTGATANLEERISRWWRECGGRREGAPPALSPPPARSPSLASFPSRPQECNMLDAPPTRLPPPPPAVPSLTLPSPAVPSHSPGPLPLLKLSQPATRVLYRSQDVLNPMKESPRSLVGRRLHPPTHAAHAAAHAGIR